MTDGYTGFRPKYHLDGRSAAALQPFKMIISNSVVLEEGDRVKLVAANGVSPADAVADKTFGYVVGFVTNDNIPVRNVANDSNKIDGTYVEAGDGDQYTAASDNLTDKKVCALVLYGDGLVCSARLDAAAGTTTGSNLPNYYIDILTTDSTQLDENTTVSNAVANFLTLSPNGGDASTAVDPTDTRRVYVVSAESQTTGDSTRLAE